MGLAAEIYQAQQAARGRDAAPTARPDADRAIARKLTPIFALAALFLVLAPLSTSTEASAALKLARVGVTVGIIFLIANFRHRSPMGRASRMLVLFSVVFTVAAVYSTAPIPGLQNKCFFFFSCLAGLCLSTAIPSFGHLDRLCRFLGWTAVIVAFLVFYKHRTGGAATVVLGRLSVESINANSVGFAAAVMLLFAPMAALRASTFNRRAFAWLGTAVLLWVVVGSGSRGALIFTLLGSLTVVAPLLRKRAGSLVFIVLTAAFALGFLVDTSGYRNDEGVGLWRFLGGDVTRNTRGNHWAFMIEHFYEPANLIGHGYLNFHGKMLGTLNAYLQVLLELGPIGLLWFLLAVFKPMLRARSFLRWPRRTPASHMYTWLALSTLMGLAIYSMVESSVLFGATLGPFILGFSVGLVDQLPRLRQRELMESGNPGR